MHDRLIDLAEELLGTDLRLYQAMLSAKYCGGRPSDEQLLHVDFGNHTLVVPRHEPGYQQLEMFVYLSDVTPETAATRMVSRRLTPDIPVERTYLSQTTTPTCTRPRSPPRARPGRSWPTGPTSTTAGVRMTAPRTARFMVHVSYKPAGHRLAGLARLAQRRPRTCRGTGSCRDATVRQLTVLGFPPAGPSLLERADPGRGGRPLPDARPHALAGPPAGAGTREA